MLGPRGEEPVLCRLVWVSHGSRYETMRNWSIRNRLFTTDKNGYYKQVHYEYGIGFYTQPGGAPGAFKARVSLSALMANSYLFTNGMH